MSFLMPNSEKQALKSIKQLVVNDKERFRLEVNNKLVYAKGKINLVLNGPEDGAGKSIGQYSGSRLIHNAVVPVDSAGYTTEGFAFYKEGFYHRSGSVATYAYYGHYDSLSNIILDRINDPRYKYRLGVYNFPVEFLGGYTTLDNSGKKIDTIRDIERFTDLFKPKNDSSVPEITLYAHGKILTVKVKVHNISRKGVKSSFIYQGKRINEDVTFEVPYNTEIISYINKQITKPKYISGACDLLDNTQYKEELHNGPQKFLGGSFDDYSMYDAYVPSKNKGTKLYSSSLTIQKKFNITTDKLNTGQKWGEDKSYDRITIEDFKNKVIHIYPHFEALVIGKKTNIDGEGYGGKYKIYAFLNPADNDQDFVGTGGVSIGQIEKDSPPYPGDSKQYFYSWVQRINPFRYTYIADRSDFDARGIPPSSTVVCTLTRSR